MGRGTNAEIAARNAEMSAYIAAHPELTYTEIGRAFDVSASCVSKVAARYNLRRERGNQHTYGRKTTRKATDYVLGYAQRRAAPKCRICTILTERIEEGVAWVRAKKGPVRVCQSCVERYHPKYVLGWITPPVDGKEERHEAS